METIMTRGCEVRLDAWMDLSQWLICGAALGLGRYVSPIWHPDMVPYGAHYLCKLGIPNHNLPVWE